VAREGYRGLKQGRRVVIPGSTNKVVAAVVHSAPHRLLLKITDPHQKGRAPQRLPRPRAAAPLPPPHPPPPSCPLPAPSLANGSPAGHWMRALPVVTAPCCSRS